MSSVQVRVLTDDDYENSVKTFVLKKNTCVCQTGKKTHICVLSKRHWHFYIFYTLANLDVLPALVTSCR